MNNQIRIETQLTEEDYVLAGIELLLNNRMIYFLKLSVVHVLIGFLLGATLVFVLGMDPTLAIIIVIVFLIYAVVSSMASVRKRLKLAYNENGQTQEITVYIINEDAIKTISDSYSSEVSWQNIHKVTESETLIHVYLTNKYQRAIPKRDFAEGELDSFKQLVFRKLTANRIKFLKNN